MTRKLVNSKNEYREGYRPYAPQVTCEYWITDIIDGLNRLRDSEVDMIYADPPYKVGKDIMGDEKDSTMRLYYIWMTEWMYEAVHRLKVGGHFYLSMAMRFAPQFLIIISDPSEPLWDAGFDEHKVMYLNYWLRFRNWRFIYWKNVHKPHPFSIANYNMNYEPILYFTKGLAKDKATPINKVQGLNCDCVIPCKTVHDKRHPTQKPLELYRDIILHSTKIGDLIVDCFTGSGNLLIHARKYNRRSIGIDADGKYIGDFNRAVATVPIGQSLKDAQRRIDI